MVKFFQSDVFDELLMISNFQIWKHGKSLGNAGLVTKYNTAQLYHCKETKAKVHCQRYPIKECQHGNLLEEMTSIGISSGQHNH